MVGQLIISKMCCHSLLWRNTPLPSRTICVWWIILLSCNYWSLFMWSIFLSMCCVAIKNCAKTGQFKVTGGSWLKLSWRCISSSNSGIPKDSYLNHEYKLTLPGIDKLIHFIRLRGCHCHIYTEKDLARAFRQIPLDPKDGPLLGFVVNNQLYFHTRFPFGLRSPTMVCQRVTKAVIHILTTEGYLADVYIDDFYRVELPELAGVAFNRMTELFEELGLEASPAKDQLPNTQMLVLEIWFNTHDMTISVPEFRLLELTAELSHWLELEQATKHQLQVLVGKLSYVCSCVRPRRAFTSRLLNELRSCDSRCSTIPES